MISSTAAVAPAVRSKTLETQICCELAAHPGSHIFTSFPRAGTLRDLACWPRSAIACSVSSSLHAGRARLGLRRSPAGPAATSPTPSGW